MPGPVSRIDGRGRYVFANKVYYDWFGKTHEQIIGKTHKEVLDSEIFKQAEPSIKIAMTGMLVTYESRATTIDGKRRYCHTTLVPSLTADGLPDGFFTIVHDITALKHAESKVIHTSRLASLGEMSAGIAHEISNPLAIIAGTINQVSKYANDPEKLLAKIDMIQNAVGRIEKIVRGLKKFSRTGEENCYKKHKLSTIVRDSISFMEMKSEQYGSPIECSIRSESIIECDEVEIGQVLINLIGNAIDAVKNQDDRWVKIELYDYDNQVILTVTDSGPGIPADLQIKLFNPFFTTKIAGEGTGLGLSISKGILDGHKASITIRPNVPNTCFEVCFQKAIGAQAA